MTFSHRLARRQVASALARCLQPAAPRRGAGKRGTTAIMLARALGAAEIVATAGSDEKCRACEKIGATRAVNYRDEDFVQVVREATGGRGVDVVIDIVAGAYVAKNIALLADDGRLERKTAIAREVEQHAWPLLSNGTIALLIDSVFPLAQAEQAHRRLESSAHIGKIILTNSDRTALT